MDGIVIATCLQLCVCQFLNVYIRWWLAWAIPDVPAKTKLQTQRVLLTVTY